MSKVSKKAFHKNKISKNKTLDLSPSNNNKEKLIKLHRDNKIVTVPYDDYLTLKKINLEDLEVKKDFLKFKYKLRKEKFISQTEFYNFDQLNKISIERENEFREIILFLQNEMRKERKVFKTDLINFYETVILTIKNICDDVNQEIDEKVKTVARLVKMNITNCDFRLNKLLEKKVNEKQFLIDYFYTSIHQMKKIISDFDICNKKIFEFREQIYKYKEDLIKENIKHIYLKQIMKEYKIKINNMTNLMEDNKNNKNLKTLLNESYRQKSTINPSSSRNKKFLNNLKNFSSKRKINKSAFKRNDLLLKIDESITKNKSIGRPFSSRHRLATSNTLNNANNSTKRTNYSNSNTIQSNFRVNSSRGRTINFEKHNYNNIFERKFNQFRYNLSHNILKNNKYSNFISSDEIKENKSYTKPELNSIHFIKKDIKLWKNKKNEILKKLNESIPDNDIYKSLENIIKKLKTDKDNLIVDGINNEYLNNHMKALPIQNKDFRDKFVETLFNDPNIFEAIKNSTNQNNNKYFEKNLFGAKKLKKNSKKKK